MYKLSYECSKINFKKIRKDGTSMFYLALNDATLFQLPEEQKCVICNDGYRSLVRSYGGSRRGMQYEE